MELGLILAPYHLGVERTGMGLGLERFLQAGIHHELGSRDHGVHIHTIQRRTNNGQDESVAVDLNVASHL